MTYIMALAGFILLALEKTFEGQDTIGWLLLLVGGICILLRWTFYAGAIILVAWAESKPKYGSVRPYRPRPKR